MSADDDAQVERIANEIARYVQANQRSKDNLEGVRTCWLGGDQVNAPRAKVESALERLMKRGVLKQEVLPDGGVIYCTAG